LDFGWSLFFFLPRGSDTSVIAQQQDSPAFFPLEQQGLEALLIYQNDGTLLFSNRIADKLCQSPPPTKDALEARFTLHTFDGQAVPEQFGSFWRLETGHESESLECIVNDAVTGESLECRLRGVCITADDQCLHLIFMLSIDPPARWLHWLVASNPLPALVVKQDTLQIVTCNKYFKDFSGTQTDVSGLRAVAGLEPIVRFLEALPKNQDVTRQTLPLHISGRMKTVSLALSRLSLTDRAHYYLILSETVQEHITAEDLRRAIALTLSETPQLSREILHRLNRLEGKRAPAPSLTEREMDVLNALARGEHNDAIAAQLTLAQATVKNYVIRIYRKLGVHSRAEAIIWARKHGYGLS
jgi:DNA-binding CsgD family transcriptional regulator